MRHTAGTGFDRGAHGLEAAVNGVVAHRAVDEAGEEIVLSPHHALGHAGGAAGVEHVEVVAAAAPGRAHPADGRLGRVVVGSGPLGARAGAVVDPQPALDPGHAVEDALDPFGEGAVEDHGHRVGVVPQVAQLVVAVAVVGVDRDQADFHRGEGALQVLGAVVEVEGHLVLLGHAEVEQELGHAVGPVVELLPADGAAALGHRGQRGLYVCHRLPDVCVIPIRHHHAPIRHRHSDRHSHRRCFTPTDALLL